MIVPSRFRPAWWLRNPHLQTLFPTLLRRTPKPALRREQLELPDGDFLHLDWLPERDGPLLLVLHGLEGSVDSHYARGILSTLADCDIQGVLMHFRGCSGVPNRKLRSYHSGETGDLQTVVETLRQRYPDRPLATLGYSLGGNAMLKWLGEQGEQAPVAAAFAVSVPFDLGNAADTLERGTSRLYQRHLIGKLHRSVTAKMAVMDHPLTRSELEQLRTFRTFDDAITAPIHGFDGVDDYYGKSSCSPYLRNIRVPTLILHARDDPFMSPAAIPGDADLSPSVRLELSARGGHVGFVNGAPWKPHYWHEGRICEEIRNLGLHKRPPG